MGWEGMECGTRWGGDQMGWRESGVRLLDSAWTHGQAGVHVSLLNMSESVSLPTAKHVSDHPKAI